MTQERRPSAPLFAFGESLRTDIFFTWVVRFQIFTGSNSESSIGPCSVSETASWDCLHFLPFAPFNWRSPRSPAFASRSPVSLTAAQMRSSDSERLTSDVGSCWPGRC